MTDTVTADGHITSLLDVVAWLLFVASESATVSEGEMARALGIDRMQVREAVRDGRAIADALRERRLARVRHEHEIDALLSITREHVVYVDDAGEPSPVPLPGGGKHSMFAMLDAARTEFPHWPLLSPPDVMQSFTYPSLPSARTHCTPELPPIRYFRSPALRHEAEAAAFSGNATPLTMCLPSGRPWQPPGAWGEPVQLLGIDRRRRRRRRRPACGCCARAGVPYGPHLNAALTFHCGRGCRCHVR